MSKKKIRHKKKTNGAARSHRVTADGRILTPDGRETLLGNLAPVKKIPMLPWKHIVVLPSLDVRIEVKKNGETAWLYRLLGKIMGQSHNLIGFTPVGELDATGYERVGVGSMGVAVEVCGLDEAKREGYASAHLKGVCRYENTGFLPSEEDHFWINVHWLDDFREPDSLVKPHYQKCLVMLETLARASGGRMKNYENMSRMPYGYEAAQVLSNIMEGGFGHWFTAEERAELFRTRSVSARFRKINERAKECFPEMEKDFLKMS